MPNEARFLVLLGPPMSGKGTQAARLTQLLGIPQVASGDLFRDNINYETNLGLKSKKYIDRGNLVPDEITIIMVKERLHREDCRKGALLDGFPRTIPQAEALDEILAEVDAYLAAVILIAVPEDILVARASGRRICRSCGHSFHLVFDPPGEDGVCDHDGGELYQREDDKSETFRQRLEVYQEQTSPLIEFYRVRSILQEINGDQPIDDVAVDIMAVISEL